MRYLSSDLDQSVQCLSKVWQRLPRVTRNKINKTTRKRHKQASSKQLPKIFQTDTRHEIVTLWSKNYLLFFDEELPPSSDFQHYPMAVSYKLLLNTESRRETDKLRTRFYKVLLYQLKDRLCETYLRSNTLDMITRFATTSSRIDCEFNTVKQSARKWAQSGGKYNSLCRDLA